MRARLQGFKGRARAQGLPISEKDGFRMSAQRINAVTVESITAFTNNLMRPLLRDLQQQHSELGSQLTMDHVGNIDEWGLDLNALITAGGGYVVVEGELCNINTPSEQAPHFTVLGGFMGSKPLLHVMIVNRKTVHLDMAQHLKADPPVVAVYGTESGWVSNEAKARVVLCPPHFQFIVCRQRACAQP
jgi:hypothetical protein